MSKERKSFLLHFDSLGILDQLTLEQCGKLFIACRDFNLGKDIELDDTLGLVFFPFKNQFSRDQEKYQVIVDRNKSNGSRGGRPKNPKEPKKPSGLSGNPSKPKKADSVSGNGSVTDSGNDNDSDNKKEVTIDRFAEFWDLYDKKSDSAKCKKKFSKLTKTEIGLLFSQLPLYVKSTPDKQFRKNPITWLNGKCWNDEIQQASGPVHSFEQQNYQSGAF